MQGGGNNKQNYFRKFLIIFVVCLLSVVNFAPYAKAAGASLFFSPSSGNYKVGEIFTVGIYVGSNDQSMNAASGVITFPVDKLEVISLNKGGTIMSLWVQEPAYNNTGGTISFEGIALNPGYIGTSGNLISIAFKAKTNGTASLNFSSGSVLANDGQGTEILSGMGSASFTIGEVKPKPEPEPSPTPEPSLVPEPAIGVLSAPVISSSTHPDQNKWYINNNPIFSWALPTNATGVSILINEKLSSNPGPTSDGLMSQQVYKDVDDGIWYLHLKLKNSAGWSEITHYRFQIDTTEPDYLIIKEVEREHLTIPKVEFSIKAMDEISGIDYYEIQIDNGEKQTWQKNNLDNYQTEELSAGNHLLLVKAFDKAGNYISSVAEFVIEAVPPPVITDYPKKVNKGDIIIIKGTAVPNSKVTIYLKGNPENLEYETSSDFNGNFSLIIDDVLKTQIYKLRAITTNEYGVDSLPCQEFSIKIKWSGLDIGSWPKSLTIFIIILIVLDLILSLILWVGLRRSKQFKHGIEDELKKIKRVLLNLRKPAAKKPAAHRKNKVKKKK